jgi:MinD-like ATPase involved in chromosome partitioning or flagellar assembly
MAKEQVFVPAGPPVGTVHVQARPAAPDHDPSFAKSPQPVPNSKPTPEPKPKLSFDDKLPIWVRESKPSKKGLRMAIWWTYCVLRLYKISWVPVPQPFWSYKNQTTFNIDSIRAKRDRIMGIVAVASRKGGTGKTSVSSWMNSMFSLLIDIMSALFDADSGSDAAGGRHGIHPDPNHLTSLQVTKMILNYGWKPTKEDFTRKVAFDKLSQAYVIPYAIDIEITPEEMATVAHTLKPACDLLFLDTAPGIKEKNTEGAIEASTVTILTARHNVEDDMRGISLALAHKPYGLRTSAKSDGVIIVLNAVKWYNFNKRTQYMEAEKFNVRPDQVVLIPFRRYLYNTKQVDLSNVSNKVVFAWTNLMLAIANAAERYNKMHPARLLPGEDEVKDLNPSTVIETEEQEAPYQSAPVDAH